MNKTVHGSLWMEACGWASTAMDVATLQSAREFRSDGGRDIIAMADVML